MIINHIDTSMREAFRESLIRHIDDYRVPIARLAKETGLKRSLIDNLYHRRTVEPGVDTATKLAGFFGKTVDQFIGNEEDPELARIKSLAARLDPETRKLFEVQLETFLRKPR